MKDKYILDSSVWIEIERKNPKVLESSLPWIENNEICLVDVIVAEVLRGVKTKRDYRILQEAFRDFPQIGVSWESVAELAFRVSKRGFQPPLIDLYIAQCAWENGKTLVSQDKHFRAISKIQPFDLILL